MVSGLPSANVQYCLTLAYGDSSLPGVILAGGSQQTASIGAAVMAAQRELVTQLLKLAADDSPLAGLKPDEVHALNGGLAKVDEPARWESYTVILGRAGRDELTVEASAPPPFETMHWSMHSYGAMFCEVRVNVVTSETRVSRFLGSFDCGRILNAKTARSQFRGGIVMGLGLALMEETEFDERKRTHHEPECSRVPRASAYGRTRNRCDLDRHSRSSYTHGCAWCRRDRHHWCRRGKRVRDLPITLDKLM